MTNTSGSNSFPSIMIAGRDTVCGYMDEFAVSWFMGLLDNGDSYLHQTLRLYPAVLLQEFDSIELDSDAQPPESRPLAKWKGSPGTKGTDKLWPKSHLTLYSYKGVWMRMRRTKEDH
ncbi:hypothetical protein Clacol_003024 [Clathrus columnatus]|uniref:Uncharacterized protein n=1 Tax=Clathrus columnatus TaxID=1419009 RepID=A0AAV5A3H3_9AGAM|nr:hypothetical protein Clacol_003024 [Clathrus columnatus]